MGRRNGSGLVRAPAACAAVGLPVRRVDGRSSARVFPVLHRGGEGVVRRGEGDSAGGA